MGRQEPRITQHFHHRLTDSNSFLIQYLVALKLSKIWANFVSLDVETGGLGSSNWAKSVSLDVETGGLSSSNWAKSEQILCQLDVETGGLSSSNWAKSEQILCHWMWKLEDLVAQTEQNLSKFCVNWMWKLEDIITLLWSMLSSQKIKFCKFSTICHFGPLTFFFTFLIL